MSGTNIVILKGYLTRDMELKYTQSGTAIGKFSIGVNKAKKINNEWQNEGHFFRITIWDKLAEKCKDCLKKGIGIIVYGELRQNRYEKNGENISSVEVTGKEIALLPTAKKRNEDQEDYKNEIPF